MKIKSVYGREWKSGRLASSVEAMTRKSMKIKPEESAYGRERGLPRPWSP